MAGKLITLPLRVWFRSARLLTRVAGDAAGRAVSLAGQTIGVALSNGSSSDRGRPAGPATAEPGWREESIEQPVTPVDVEHPREEPERRSAPTQPPAPVHASEQPEPVRVSEQPEPVRVSEQP